MTMCLHRFLLMITILLSIHAAQAGSAISPPAERLAHMVDSLDVEHHWPAGQHVQWETGDPDGRAESGSGKHTHCSAFVAAAAKRVGIYILRPPDHPQLLLANAQVDWLGAQGPARGWKPLADGLQAQQYANEGWLVVAAYRNHDDERPGHIAIVRASDKDAQLLAEEGPQVTQAGGTNYRSVALRTGFAGHPLAWSRHEVRYYAHAVDPAALGAAGF